MQTAARTASDADSSTLVLTVNTGAHIIYCCDMMQDARCDYALRQAHLSVEAQCWRGCQRDRHGRPLAPLLLARRPMQLLRMESYGEWPRHNTAGDPLALEADPALVSRFQTSTLRGKHLHRTALRWYDRHQSVSIYKPNVCSSVAGFGPEPVRRVVNTGGHTRCLHASKSGACALSLPCCARVSRFS